MNYEAIPQNSDYKHEHAYRFAYLAIDAYEPPPIEEEWLSCPNCGLRPLRWVFDNGRSTACGCGENQYHHFSVTAQDITSFMKANNGSLEGYDRDELRKNWNDWVKSAFGE